MQQLNNTFRSGGMSTSFNDSQFLSFVQYLKADRCSIVKAVSVIGQQMCGKVWVLGPQLQLNQMGKCIPKEEYHYIFMDRLLMQARHQSNLNVLPSIRLPLPESPSSLLSQLVHLLRVVMKHNFYSSVLVLAGGVMALHYQTLQSLGGCPTIVAYGPGKSTSLSAALSEKIALDAK